MCLFQSGVGVAIIGGFSYRSSPGDCRDCRTETLSDLSQQHVQNITPFLNQTQHK